MARYVLAPAARDDLEEIASYIAADDPVAARRFLLRVRGAFRMLAARPQAGHLREDLTNEPLRFWPVGRYIVIYRPDITPIQIVHVVSGRRDIGSILRGGAEPNRP